ncbi:hypothetical protein CG709_06860, partial [Lachnotalea glycerini]
AINELGVNFPEDISIIGFDNLMLSKIVKPTLWTIVQPMEEIAASAANLMLKRLNKSETGEAVRVNLSTGLLTGESIKQLS